MTTPPAFKEPTSNRSGRVTVKDVARATEKAKRTDEVRGAHDEALAGFASENPLATHRFGQVDFGSLIIDHAIQRPENPFEVSAIARDFNPAALGMITVSRRVIPATDTEPERIDMVVIDGQQRRAAALRVGYDGLVHADVHDGLTRKDEARLFRQLNFRRSVQPITLFKTALVEEDPHALAVQAVLDGLRIPFGTSKGYMAAKGAVRLVKRPNGVTHLEWALRQIKKLYDRGSGGVYDGAVVEAFFMFHERYGNRIDERTLFDRLANDEGSNSGLVEFGKTLKRAHSSTLPVGIIRAILDRYNKGKWKTSKAYLPDWE